MTSNKKIIHAYEDIDPYPIGGVKVDDIAIICTGKGYLSWISNEGILTMLVILYCAEVDEPIVSPTMVVQQNITIFQGFHIDADVDHGTGTLQLVHRDGVSHLTYPMTLRNGLWFHHYKPQIFSPTSISKLNNACLRNLWHGQLAHTGEDVMDEIHKHVIGIDKPIKCNLLYKCGSCLPHKTSKQPHKRAAKHKRKLQKADPTLSSQKP